MPGRYVRDQFRITPRPGGIIPAAPVRLYDPAKRGDKITWSRHDPNELPEPTLAFLDLQDLDLDDVGMVLEFCKTHGPVLRRFDDRRLGVRVPETIDSKTSRIVARNTIGDVVGHLRLVQAAAVNAMDMLEGIPTDVWARPALTSVPYLPGGVPPLPLVVNAGLDAYRPALEWDPQYLGDDNPRPREQDRWFSPRPDLFSALCLQVFNAVAAGRSPLVCANETCGRRFFVQQGRAEYRQHRTSGVKFCTDRCARAQAQREYRRRQKQEGSRP